MPLDCALLAPTDKEPHLKEVLPGVLWGRPEWLLSPSYWAALAVRRSPSPRLFAKPSSLIEEIGFCLLGGFGIKAEVNFAAHRRLVSHGMYRRKASADEIEALLRVPLSVEGRSVRYRFPKQRGIRLALAIKRCLEETIPSHSAKALRDYLLKFDGIGPKTASWITRNWLSTNEVAIIDVHVERACRAMGLFGPDLVIHRDYFLMEERFLAFAREISVPAATLDAIMWSEMRKMNALSMGLSDIREDSNGEWRRRRRRRIGRREQQAEKVEAAA